MKKTALVSFMTASIMMAGGYKIPETSTNAVALGAANVAHNQNNADAAYYNPAKMVFMSDENHLEGDLTYIGLKKVKYKGTYTDSTHHVFPSDESSQSEDFIIPTLHYVSGALGENGVRVGLSIVAPGGLSKQWTKQNGQGIKTAKEFTLETIEINPTAAFTINDKIAVAVGFRILHSYAVAKALYRGVVFQDMNGDSTDFGYNLALAYNPVNNVEIGLTYRSKINMNLDGDADLFYVASTHLNPEANYDGGVNLPLPAALNIAVAYTFSTKTTLEVVYEKTFWSAYKTLDFNYPNPYAEGVFGRAKPKDWKNTNTFRFGLTQELKDLTVMAGLVIDKTPVPEHTIGYELPDTDSTAVSLGGRYKINESVDVGLSVLYSMHEDRTVNNSSLNGEFTDGDVLIISAGLGYKF